MSLAIEPRFQPQVLRDEPLSRHTSWHVGGPADVFFMPRDREELIAFLRALPDDVPLLWLGLGSNLLVRDGGVRGVVIKTQDALGRLERRGDLRVYAEAGVPCAKLARQCARWALGPAAFFAGIPGTVGGALAMNAGAFGGETWPLVREVETVSRDGTVRARAAGEYRTGYRSVTPPADGEWFLAATLELATGADETRHARAARPAPTDAADRRMELRLGVHESARRSRRAPHRSEWPQGPAHRRRRRVAEACEFHPERRRGARERHRSADRARAGRGGAPPRRVAASGSARG